MSNIIGLDFETYGAVSLPTHGLQRYSEDETFRPLIASIYTQAHGALTVDFVKDWDQALADLTLLIGDNFIACHNAGFERRVLQTLGIDLPADRFVDSAVVARAAGAGGSLEAAAPQLLGVDKLADGRRLIMLFSVPGDYQTQHLYFDRRIVDAHPDEWLLFKEYCELDAKLSYEIVQMYAGPLNLLPGATEHHNQTVTMEMNSLGWPVDIKVVEEMHRRYKENQEVAAAEFAANCDAADLNLNSLKQLKEWCEKRGIKASSFDEKAVAKLHARISKKLDQVDANTATLKAGQYESYVEVLQMLETKQILGGSSLKKLQVILDTVGIDGRLRDQYLHIGAGQSYRTTGRSVQMQNLKRIGEPDDMDTLFADDSEWTNTDLARNLRQVFTSSNPQGRLIVGDFASVESRGLAWLAGEEWKLDAYRQGKDVYKALAMQIYPGTTYDAITKVQRQTGKVGELSCGYGAGPGAVQAFATNMGVEMSEGEATKLVVDWRQADENIVNLWHQLDTALENFMVRHASSSATTAYEVRVGPAKNFVITLRRMATPVSLLLQHSSARSMSLTLTDPNGMDIMSRVFHGLYRRGKDICYYKPSERKTGDLWSPTFTDPKTKQLRYYNIYGGKLTGILTQSLCRQIFFNVLREVRWWVGVTSGLDLIGQFHDEIVLDWKPECQQSLSLVQEQLEMLMSVATGFPGFPMAAEVKHDYRYTK